MAGKNAGYVEACPCGSDTAYTNCCGMWHAGQSAPTAETLMRSRYTAYVLGLEDYLLYTWHPDTRPASLGLSEDVGTKWLGLDVRRSESTGADSALVEFIARYKVNGKACRLHEVSRFIKLDGQWLYLDAT